ncbi:hypothetical protein [Moraxella sp. ZY200743]|uniref:hypothetical protein n=1 Tax=Moraxella sp. ZY200743 TaxID=2911970 RepID=UPI003D7D5DBD
MLIRCSSLDDLMTKPRSGGGLSATAKGVIEKLAIESRFATPILFGNKYTKKGIECENDSIELFNTVFFKNLKKNDVRLSNDYITGECDLIDGDTIIDIKTSWDIKSFASQMLTPTVYEWQLRGYMWLYDKDKACTVHCLVDTPTHLCQFDDGVHEFEHIPMTDRIIVGNVVKRDAEKEQELINKIELARAYYQEVLDKLTQKGRLP